MPVVSCCEIGSVARGLLASGASGRVLAGLSRAAYLLTDKGEVFWLAVECTPMHARSVRLAGTLQRLAAGQAFVVASERIQLGSGLTVDCRTAPTWTAPAWPDRPIVAEAEVARRACAALSSGFDLAPARGLGRLIPRMLSLPYPLAGGRPEAEPVLVRAWPAIRAIWLACSRRDAAAFWSEAAALVGLGEGLTPSGDDFLGALLFALHVMPTTAAWLAERPSAQAQFLETARQRTHPISYTLLRDLASGEAVAPLHEFVGAAIGAGPLDGMRQAAARLTCIGHATGWDLLAGVLAGLLLGADVADPPVAPGAFLTRSVCSQEGKPMEIKEKIERANEEAARRLILGEPVLVDIAPAGEAIPGMAGKMITHAGPPIAWRQMCGAQKGAIIGMVLFEGWANTVAEAIALLERGEVQLEPNHHHQAVGPMAGTISPSLPVWVVENRAFGNVAFCRQVEANQQFGDYSEAALQGLRLWRDVWAPTLRRALRASGGLELKPIITKALQMGDELHNRHSASSSLFANAMAVAMAQTGSLKRDEAVSTLKYVTNHDLVFLGLAMAAGKAIADAAHGVEYSTVVTAMCRNGVEFGIRVSGLGDEWFTAPAPAVDGLYLPGYSAEDAGLDMGDSAITETVGWGGFVLGGAPGILSLVGGTPDEALAYSREMRQITVATHPTYRMPALGFVGTSIGIDIRRVVQTGITPIIDTAIAHRDPGHPKIGAGLLRAPLECFKKALIAFGQRYAAR